MKDSEPIFARKPKNCKDCVYYSPQKVYPRREIIETTERQIKKISKQKNVYRVKKVSENTYEVTFIEVDRRPYCNRRKAFVHPGFGDVCEFYTRREYER